MSEHLNIVVWLHHPDVDCFTFGEAAMARLRLGIPGATVTVCQSEARFLAALPGADVAAVWRFEQAWFEPASRLRLLVTPAAGRDYFSVTPPARVRLHYCHFHGAIMKE